jgi:hypothetical protein
MAEHLRIRHVIAVIVSFVAVAAVVCVALTNYWQRKQPVFKDASKLITAMRAFSEDLKTRGQPLPPSVSLRELVSGGYILARDVRAFDGMDVTISLTADETHPQDVLIRVRLSDGSVIALLTDGSVQGLPK